MPKSQNHLPLKTDSIYVDRKQFTKVASSNKLHSRILMYVNSEL